jgi:hypothetical protein
MKTLAWAGLFISSLYVSQIFMHLFNLDGTGGLGDISGKEITKEHVESGRVGADIIAHVSSREGVYHFAITIIVVNIMWSGYAPQKLFTMGIYFVYLLSKLAVKFYFPWNGVPPTDTFELGKPLANVKMICLHPMFILLFGAYFDDDIYEYFGGQPPAKDEDKED